MNGTGTRPVPVWSGSGLAPKHRPLSGVARQKLGSRLTASRAGQKKIDVPRRPIMGESVGADPNLAAARPAATQYTAWMPRP